MTKTAKILRLEALLVAAVTVVVFIALGFGWWWLLVFFLVFDLSALGYLRGPRIGAFAYNLVHSYAVPVLLAGLYAVLRMTGRDLWLLAFTSGCWMFHVAADRALGYGLKHDDAFEQTHLGLIGKSRQKPKQ